MKRPTNFRQMVGPLSAVAVIALLLVVLVSRSRDHGPTTPNRAAPKSQEPEKPRLLAHVGPIEITSKELGRYKAVRELTSGAASEKDMLNSLCDRTLLVLLAHEDGLEVSGAELQGEVLRKKLIMGAASHGRPFPPGASPMGAMPGQDPLPPGAPNGMGPQDEIGVPDADLAEEARAEALAKKVKQKRVYDTIQVDNHDLLVPSRNMPDAQAPRPMPVPSASARGKDAGPPPEDPMIAQARQRIRRERGAPALAALMTQLRDRWKVTLEPQ